MAAIEDMLLGGYRPAAALDLYKCDMQLEHPSNYIYASADRAQCHDYDYVYRYVAAKIQEILFTIFFKSLH